MNKFPISLAIILVCFVICLIYCKKKGEQPWLLFPFYLFLTISVESITYIGLNFKLLKNNQWLYNLFLPIHGLFYFYVFKKIILLKYVNRIIISLTLTFLSMILWEAFSFGFGVFYFRSLIFLSVIQLFLCGLYFYSIFQQNEYANLVKEPAFWFTTGTLFYMTVVASTSIFFNELLKLQVKNQIPLRAILVMVGNLIMYSCWIKSFLCINNKQTCTTPY